MAFICSAINLSNLAPRSLELAVVVAVVAAESRVVDDNGCREDEADLGEAGAGNEEHDTDAEEGLGDEAADDPERDAIASPINDPV